MNCQYCEACEGDELVNTVACLFCRTHLAGYRCSEARERSMAIDVLVMAYHQACTDAAAERLDEVSR